MHASNAGTAHELLPFLWGCTQLHKHVRMGTVTGLDVHKLYSHLLHLHRLLHLHSMSTPTAAEAKINCLGPPQHRSCDPQGLRGGDRTPTHTPLPTKGCNIPQNQGCVPRDYMARGSPLQPHTSLCPPAAPGGGLHTPNPPAPQDPLPSSLRGPGGCSPFHLWERGAPGCPGEDKRGEKGGKKGKKKRLALSEPPEARPSHPLPQAADPV